MRLTYLAATALLWSCASLPKKNNADLIVYNATVYTVDDQFSKATALAVGDGKILATGSNDDILNHYDAAEKIDAAGKFIYPGFIDAHAHFLNYGLSLQSANLVGTRSWNDVLQRLQEFAQQKKLQPGEWLTGRGWDQNDWDVKSFPDKSELDRLFPNNPVVLTRVDGHAAIANQKALDISGVKAGQTLTGGEVEVKNGKLTGVLVDNATRLVSRYIPAPQTSDIVESLDEAQKNCFAVGLTSVDDCGLNYRSVLLMDSLHKAGLLKMRVYAMLSDASENYAFAKQHGKIKTPRLNVRAFKVYADGALGSRGAALLEPYTDRHDWYGFLLSKPEHFDSVASVISDLDFQMCTHAIGDSGNRTILKIYGKYLQNKNDKRWRIEHAQVVNQNDFDLFGKYSVVPSVQPTHATSDMYWAGDRLGAQRVKGAYAYKHLLQENGWLPLGTDFPVEDISPFKTFYAAVFRMDAENWPAGGYQMENALSREEAIRGMTIWAAKSNFEEHEKGSLEKGKFADFIILDHDLMKAAPQDALHTKVLATYINGEKVYESN